MSPTSSRTRRPLALMVALVVAAVGLSVAPAATANAYSTTSSQGKLLTYINGLRADASKTPWSQVTLLNNWTQDYAESYAACKGCESPSNLPSYSAAPVDGVVLLHATSSSSSGRVSKLETLIQSNGAIFGSDTWGALGYATHGDTGYVFIVGFDIASTDFPFSSFASGKSTIHGTLRVGKTLSVSVPLLNPAPTSTGYEWRVKHGSGDWSDVGTPDSPTYQPTASDLGGKISVIVTGYRTSYGPASFTAKTSDTIAHGHFGTATIDFGGTRVVGQSIEYTVNVEPNPTSMTYTWYRNGKKFTNVGNEYVLTDADRGKRIDIKIVIAKEGFTSVTLQTHTSKTVKGP